MGVRVLGSIWDSLSSTDLFFSTKSEAASADADLKRLRFSPAASLAKVFSRSPKISFALSMMVRGTPASLAT